jgi:integrase
MATIRRRKLKNGKEGNYVMRYKDRNGDWVTETTAYGKVEAQKLADKLEALEEAVRRGEKKASEVDAEINSSGLISDGRNAFVKMLIDSDVTAEYAEVSGRYIDRFIKHAKILRLNEITGENVQAWCNDIRNIDKRSPRTANTALGVMRRFCLWCERTRRIVGTPLKFTKPYSESIDIRHPRRAMSLADIAKLLEVTKTQPSLIAQSLPGRNTKPTHWIDGPTRAMLYRMAFETGFRANELRALTPNSFKLDDSPPIAVLPPEKTKNKKGARQPLRDEFVPVIREFIEGKPKDEPLFVFPKEQANMLKKDLKAAGIPYRTENGCADFHSLRAAYATMLIESGVDPKTASELLRHSNPMLTLKLYTKTTNEKKAAALNAIPSINKLTNKDGSD